MRLCHYLLKKTELTTYLIIIDSVNYIDGTAASTRMYLQHNSKETGENNFVFNEASDSRNDHSGASSVKVFLHESPGNCGFAKGFLSIPVLALKVTFYRPQNVYLSAISRENIKRCSVLVRNCASGLVFIHCFNICDRHSITARRHQKANAVLKDKQVN